MSVFDTPRERKSYIGIKNKPKFKREYVVLFNYGTRLQGKYSIIESKSLEQALLDAYAKFGRTNVSRVIALSEQSIAVQEMYGRSRV